MTSKAPNRESQRRRLTQREKMHIVVQVRRAPCEGRESFIQQLAADLHISAGTIWRWLRAFETHGSKAFVKQVRSDRGAFRFFRRNLASAFFVAAAGASGETSPSGIRAAVLREFTPDQVPSLSTIRARVKAELEEMR